MNRENELEPLPRRQDALEETPASAKEISYGWFEESPAVANKEQPKPTIVKPMDILQVDRELRAEFEYLQEELQAAETHFHLFNVLRNSIAKSETAFEKSPLLWSFTRHAHLQAAVISVCRIYDQNKSGSNFARLLKTIQKSLPFFYREHFWERSADNFAMHMAVPKGHRPSEARLKGDIEFCSVQNPLVATLKKWRDNSIAHTNRRMILGGSEFVENDPLSYESVRKLIEKGYRIVNYYSESFHGVGFSSFPVEQLDDYQGTLQMLVHHGRRK